MGVMSAVRILLADDHQLFADACKSLLEPEFEVVGIATDGRFLIAQAIALKPHVVILDVHMSQLNGLDAGARIKRAMPGVKLVFLTMSTAPHLAAEAFRRGASGYVLKQSSGEELLIAIRKAAQGGSYLSPLVAKETVAFLLKQGESRGEDKRITQRQSEILQLLVEGNSMKQVASIVDIKPGTVAFHKYKMMEKLKIKTNAALIEYAIRHQMTQ